MKITRSLVMNCLATVIIIVGASIANIHILLGCIVAAVGVALDYYALTLDELEGLYDELEILRKLILLNKEIEKCMKQHETAMEKNDENLSR